ncbi:hypothetical protein J6590_012537 [Homalodisca vitripennis]|nr:hypothetical protein J6590_012537 [Homalodisca vitripennis]
MPYVTRARHRFVTEISARCGNHIKLLERSDANGFRGAIRAEGSDNYDIVYRPDDRTISIALEFGVETPHKVRTPNGGCQQRLNLVDAETEPKGGGESRSTTPTRGAAGLSARTRTRINAEQQKLIVADLIISATRFTVVGWQSRYYLRECGGGGGGYGDVGWVTRFQGYLTSADPAPYLRDIYIRAAILVNRHLCPRIDWEPHSSTTTTESFSDRTEWSFARPRATQGSHIGDLSTSGSLDNGEDGRHCLEIIIDTHTSVYQQPSLSAIEQSGHLRGHTPHRVHTSEICRHRDLWTTGSHIGDLSTSGSLDNGEDGRHCLEIIIDTHTSVYQQPSLSAIEQSGHLRGHTPHRVHTSEICRHRDLWTTVRTKHGNCDWEIKDLDEPERRVNPDEVLITRNVDLKEANRRLKVNGLIYKLDKSQFAAASINESLISRAVLIS